MRRAKRIKMNGKMSLVRRKNAHIFRTVLLQLYFITSVEYYCHRVRNTTVRINTRDRMTTSSHWLKEVFFLFLVFAMVDR